MTWEFTDLDGRDCAPTPARLAQTTVPKTTHPTRSKRSLFFDTNEWLPGVLPRGLDYSPCDSQNRDECGWLKKGSLFGGAFCRTVVARCAKGLEAIEW